MSDIIEVIQAGKIEGQKLRMGEIVMVPVDPEKPDGPKRTTVKMSRILLKLGDGLTATGEKDGLVSLEVSAAAAKRLGWEHPANAEKPAPNVAALLKIVGNNGFGQAEQKQALLDIESVDQALALRLRAANEWLFS